MCEKNVGSSLDDLLQDEDMLESVSAVAIKRVCVWQATEEMKVQQQLQLKKQRELEQKLLRDSK